MTLTEFLLARIAEDEAARDRGRDSTGAPRAESDGWDWVKRSKAECEARRQIVARCAKILTVEGWEYDDAPDLADDVLALLALPYADHPDYDEEWRP